MGTSVERDDTSAAIAGLEGLACRGSRDQRNVENRGSSAPRARRDFARIASRTRAARALQFRVRSSAKGRKSEDIMNTHRYAATAAIISSILVTGAASAEEKDEVRSTSEKSRSLSPATHDVEMTIGTGYEQGFGNVGSGQPALTDIGTAGGAVQVGVGYRLIPQLTLGVYGSGAMFGRGDQVDPSTNLYSAAAGVQADWHFLSAGHEIDPWLSLGSGWRGYWAHGDQGTTSMQGMELAKLQIGVDYRVDEAVAIGPVVGVDLSTFFTQSTPTAGGFSNISNPNVNTFLFAGLQGRFDIPTGKSSQVASR
jgi:hypothetical protein